MSYVLNFSKSTATAITASNLASTFTSNTTNATQRTSIVKHLATQSPVFCSAFSAALQQQAEFKQQIQRARAKRSI